MSEVKRNFAQGKMNKDLDERLLDPGEYRDANNIQVSTTDGSDVGTVQTMLGNTRFIEATKLPPGCKCIGAITDGKKDNLYWFVKGPGKYSTETQKHDFILEVNVEYGSVKYVVVDNWQTTVQTSAATSNAGTLTLANAAGVRAGMYAIFNDDNGAPQKWEVQRIVSNVVTLAPLNGVAISLNVALATTIVFAADRVLKFNNDIITAINIIDDNLFWTDNQSEPKKINITRCKLGTGKGTDVPDSNVATDIPSPQALRHSPFNGQNYNIHTRLVSTFDQAVGPQIVTNAAETKAVFLQEDHVTVARKNPVTPLYLEMSDTTTDRYNQDGEPNNILTSILSDRFVDSSTGEPHDTGFVKEVFFTVGVDFRVGDIIVMKSNEEQSSYSDFSDYGVRAEVTRVPSGHSPPNNIVSGTSGDPFEITILSVIDEALNSDEQWSVTLEQKKPLFEFKFPRFSYRYKYVDGEYSTFAPWSEVAFLPGNFDYLPKQAYNLGMTNNLRSLTLTNYIVEDSLRPRDVVEVDILYKESNSPLCYTVKTIQPADGDLIWPNTSSDPYERGRLEIESEMIHAVLPANQLLRPWDNVPRFAKAQEITGNRLVYANYKQNYDLVNTGVLIRPNLDVSLISTRNEEDVLGRKSVKTMRNYQLGIVYGDEYGRETPVLTDPVTGSIKIDIEESTKNNQLQVKINSIAPQWAKTWKFYVKETSNEYYNLAMDRWYDAKDDCVWLSFPSAERNKIDEETFLILKKQHDGDVALEQEARYKCIAIESSAPKYIKKKRTSLGKVNNATYLSVVDNIIGDSSSGFPFTNTNFFTIVDTFADNTWGSDFWAFDNLEVRFYTTSGNSSKYYEVVKASPSGNNEYNITIKTKFGDDMLFTTSDDPQTWNNRVGASNSDVLQVELSYIEYEDKPEFDGRFFVKINKDLPLKENLLSIASPDTFVISAASKIQYINTVQGTGTSGSGINGVILGGVAGIPISSIGQTAAGVRTWTNGSTTYTWNPSFYTQAEFFDISNKDGSNGGRRIAMDFWYHFGTTHKNHDKGNWFIDEAAGDARVSGQKFEGYRGCGHNIPYENFIDGGVGPRYGGEIFVHPTGGILNLLLGRTQNSNSTQFSGSNTLVPNGRGIHAGGYAIDIAFSGIWPFGADDGESGVVNRLQDAVNAKPQYEQDVEFANKLFTVGAKFRFKNDPDLEVYTVLHVREIWGLRNYNPSSGQGRCQDGGGDNSDNHAYNKRQRWTVVVDKQFGSGPSEFWPLDIKHDGSAGQVIEVLENYSEEGGYNSTNPAIWETEPKEDVGLDIYYEATQAYPMDIDFKTNEQFIPVGSIVKHNNAGNWVNIFHNGSAADETVVVKTRSSSDQKVTLSKASIAIAVNTALRFEHPDGGAVHAYVATAVTAGDTSIIVHGSSNNAVQQYRPHNQNIILPWFNCYSFGNGVESDRIRDDFNQVTLGNGVKASTVLAEQYKEEHRSSGLIFSGIYNSNNGINRLNQFIQAEPITKDLNPSYGSIQKLFSRDTDLITFCEDKVLKILSNKDALFNADGNANVTSNKSVLGQAVPFVGDFGISTNPESFAADNYRIYFTDRQRAAVMRLSRDGMTPISENGMRGWFKENFGQQFITSAIGSFDKDKNTYNITINSILQRNNDQHVNKSYTLSFKESVRGWQSFHDYYPEFGVSCNTKYFTFKDGFPWHHHSNDVANNYYGVQYYSDITTIFNDQPSMVKSFNTMSYEGTQTKVDKNLQDSNYHNLTAVDGWYLESFITDLQTGTVDEFINKEGKWFNYLKGETTVLNNLDGLEFSVQGIGNPSAVTHNGQNDGSGETYQLTPEDSSAGTDGTGWDDGNTYT